MSDAIDVLWLTASPSLKSFDRKLLRYLSENVEIPQPLAIAEWEYIQTQDEACSLDVAVDLLHDYLKSQDRPIHLAGHSTSGLIGLIYARRYPQKVRSLTLLSVGAQVTANWQAHYYVLRSLFSCSRKKILAQIARSMFGNTAYHKIQDLVKALEIDLNCSPSPHSLFKLVNIPPSGVEMPLMICGSRTDTIVDPQSITEWEACLKEGDRLWLCPQGHHFFHHLYPNLVGRQILSFWQSLTPCYQYLSVGV
ncbi:MAG: alpha/beta hydrolase [Hormoscilla sp. GM102CHS1]|nr:alpha/beta hydrolase [Hormoscilla sp. GM102CHS1]